MARSRHWCSLVAANGLYKHGSYLKEYQESQIGFLPQLLTTLFSVKNESLGLPIWLQRPLCVFHTKSKKYFPLRISLNVQPLLRALRKMQGRIYESAVLLGIDTPVPLILSPKAQASLQIDQRS